MKRRFQLCYAGRWSCLQGADLHSVGLRSLALAMLLLLGACGGDSDGSRSPSPGQPPAPVILMQQTVDLPSAAQPDHTPGSPGVVVTNPKLLSQFGDGEINLNQARYTRYYLSDQADRRPEGILILVPGFQGGAANFLLLAEQLLIAAREESSLALEVWAVDRRSALLEDMAGLDIAEQAESPLVGLDYLFGDALGLELSPELVDGPNRRAVFYDNAGDTAFIAQWTPLVHSLDIDAIVEHAREQALNGNVFLGGHSAGTGYAARYAATDFDFATDAVDAGFAKIRGLVLLEGGGSSNSNTPPSAQTLDLIEARFDGGLYGAVRDQAPRCADGLTACSVDTQENDCAAFDNASCVEPQPAYSDAGGLLSPQLLAVSEVNGLDASVSGNAQLSILQQEQNGEEGNSAINRVPQLAGLRVLLGDSPATSESLLGQFLDDDGLVAQLASFVATSLGLAGPEVNGIATWLTLGDDIPPEAFTDNGDTPEALAEIGPWGVEVEPTDLRRMLPMFYQGGTNFSDWYYPSSGLSVVEGLGLDTTALSAPPPQGRGRTDIANRTVGSLIDIPVIAFGGSNGLTPTPASWRGFASTIATCAAPACDGVTERLVDTDNPSAAFPTYGGPSGGFEVHISEGYAHFDVLSATDDDNSSVIVPLLAFLERHLQ